MTRLTDKEKALVQANLGLVGVHLKRHCRIPARPMSRCEFEDLFQEGVFGLMRAAQRFDPRRDGTFAAFALRHIHGAISAALAERFATVRVPVKVVKRLRQQRRGQDAPGPMPGQTVNLGDQAELLNARCTAPPESMQALGNVLRLRYDSAVRAAADRLRAQRRGRADRGTLIERLVRERMMIPEEERRTSLRQIAREMRSAPGRVLNCERQLAGLARSMLRADPVTREIVDYGRRAAPEQGDEPDAAFWRALRHQETTTFQQRVSGLDRRRLGEVLRDLAETACGSGKRLAAELYAALGDEQRARMLMRVTEDERESTAPEAD